MTTRVDQDMAVSAARMLPREISPQLRTRYRTLRMMIRTAGLAATYAYVASKVDSTPLGRAYREVRDGIRERVHLRGLVAQTASPTEVIDRLGALDTVTYLQTSAEVAQLLGWLARLADARLAEEEPRPTPLTGTDRPGGDGA